MRKNHPFVRCSGIAGRCALLALCALSACKKAPPKPARFCDQDLSGVWLNASDRHFAYRFRDQGEIVRGEYLERQDDGALKAPPEPILFELQRTAAALSGAMRSTGTAPSGRSCPIEFGIRIQSCEANALQAIVETSIPITDECRRQVYADGGEVASTQAEYRFERDLQRPKGSEAKATASDHPSDAGAAQH
jgi:hypothetical protein